MPPWERILVSAIGSVFLYYFACMIIPPLRVLAFPALWVFMVIFRPATETSANWTAYAAFIFTGFELGLLLIGIMEMVRRSRQK